MPGGSFHLLVLSADTIDRLRATASAVGGALAAQPLDAVCATLAHGRPAVEHRLAIVAATPQEAILHLGDFVAGRPSHQLAVGTAGHGGKVGFVFSGQGSAWAGMGASLWASSPAFREAAQRCDAALRAHGVAVVDELLAPVERTRLGELAISDPMIFTIGCGLVAHWRDLGIVPEGVVGHSGMEVLAAVTAGAVSLEHAAAIVVARARAAAPLVGRGAMLAIGLPAEDAAALLDDDALRELRIAAVNSPSRTVIGGPRRQIDALAAALTDRRVLARRVAFDIAAHTAVLDPVRAPLLAALPVATLRESLEPALAIYSPALGRRADRRDLGAEHWFRSVREPARFTDAIAAMIGDGYRAFVEIGPHPSLGSGVLEVAEQLGVRAVAVPSLHRHVDDTRSMVLAAGTAWVHGLAPRLDRIVPDGPRANVPVARAAGAAGEPPPRVVVRSLRGAARVAWLERYLRARLASLMSSAAELPPEVSPEVLPEVQIDRPLNTLGLDSLKAQAFKRHLEVQLEVAVPLSALLGGTTGSELARMLAGALPPVAQHSDDEGDVEGDLEGDVEADDELEEGTIDGGC